MAEDSESLRALALTVRTAAARIAFGPLANLTGRELEIARLVPTEASESARINRHGVGIGRILH
jgi:hypothetical protein